MAKFKNLEMSSTLSTNPDITVSKGFLGFGAKAIYTPTNTPLKAIINYYNAEDGEKLVKLLQMSEEQIAEKAEKMRMPQKQSMSNYRLEACLTADKQFIAIQMFGYADFKNTHLHELCIYKGKTAESIINLL